MLELGLGAYTTASHISLVLTAFYAFHIGQTLMLASDGFARMGQSGYARISVFFLLAALVCERGYYIAARILAPQGFDLWSQHPAPELLSAIVALSLFNLSAAIILVLTLDTKRAAWIIMTRLMMFLSLYIACVAFLK